MASENNIKLKKTMYEMSMFNKSPIEMNICYMRIPFVSTDLNNEQNNINR